MDVWYEQLGLPQLLYCFMDVWYLLYEPCCKCFVSLWLSGIGCLSSKSCCNCFVAIQYGCLVLVVWATRVAAIVMCYNAIILLLYSMVVWYWSFEQQELLQLFCCYTVWLSGIAVWANKSRCNYFIVIVVLWYWLYELEQQVLLQWFFCYVVVWNCLYEQLELLQLFCCVMVVWYLLFEQQELLW